MSKEIVVNKGKQTRIAIVENGELVELFIENQEHERTIGNIFLGRIRRIMPSIQAAFVDIGQKQDAFLHFTDLIENVEDWLSYAQSDTPVIGKFKASYSTRPIKKKRRHPGGSVDHHSNRSDDDEGDDDDGEHHHLADAGSRDKRKSALHRQHSRHDGGGYRDDQEDAPYVDPVTILKKDQPILVKISKEPIANKGSRITTDISLAGRFLVLVPMANYVAVSKKILSFKERRRLRALARSLLPEGFGVIVRTVADGRSAKALDTDLNLLIEKWKKLEEKLLQGHKAPVVIHEDVNMVSSIMRDLFTDDYDRITLDDQRLYRNIKGYVQAIAPDMVADVKFHQGPESIFDKAGIAQAVEEAFDSRVNLPSGGYLFIETTEAMHVIDVNSGRAGRGLSQEENSLRVNIEAAKILSKQVRLRDLGGILVVDFIDMRNERNRRKVYETLKTEFRKDRAVTKVLTMSDFGLIQITRQRLRPSITKTFSLPEGTEATPRNWNERAPSSRLPQEFVSKLSPQDFKNDIESWFANFKASGRSGKVVMVLHPFTASYLESGLFKQIGWFIKYGVRVEIAEESSLDPMAFRFLDGRSNQDITSLPKLKEVPRSEPKTPVVKSAAVNEPDAKKAAPAQEDARSRGESNGQRDDRRGSSSGSRPDSRNTRNRDNADSHANSPRGRDSRGSDSKETDSSSDELLGRPIGGGRDTRGQRDGGRDNRGRNARGREDDDRDNRDNRDNRGRDARGQEGNDRDNSGRDDRGRDARSQEGNDRDDRGRDNRGRDARSQEGNDRDNSGRDNRGRDARGQEGNDRDNSGRDDRGRDARGQEGNDRDNSGRDNRGRDARSQEGNDRDDRDNSGRDNRGRDTTDRNERRRGSEEPEKSKNDLAETILPVKSEENLVVPVTDKRVAAKLEVPVEESNAKVSDASDSTLESPEGAVKAKGKPAKPKARRAPAKSAAKKPKTTSEEISESTEAGGATDNASVMPADRPLNVVASASEKDSNVASTAKATAAKKTPSSVAKPAKPEEKPQTKSTGPPSRHRLEKYDFSKAAQPKAEPIKKEVTSLDVAEASNNGDAPTD